MALPKLNDNKELIDVIKLLVQIRPGDTISPYYNTIMQHNMRAGFWRNIVRESRKDTVKFITNIVNRICESDDSDILAYISDVKRGLNNLAETYSKDTNTSGEINSLDEKLSMKLCTVLINTDRELIQSIHQLPVQERELVPPILISRHQEILQPSGDTILDMPAYRSSNPIPCRKYGEINGDIFSVVGIARAIVGWVEEDKTIQVSASQ
jgi:hypothetical protein